MKYFEISNPATLKIAWLRPILRPRQLKIPLRSAECDELRRRTYLRGPSTRHTLPNYTGGTPRTWPQRLERSAEG
ncbi:hypothetical protein VTN02DRAFT_1114 [Thermoascus thermophilus]